MKLNINALALIGAIIGIISIFLPWTYYYSMHRSGHPGDNLLYLSSIGRWAGHQLVMPAFLFIISSLLALISPLSSIGQISSIVLFLNACDSINKDTFEDYVSLTFGIWIGALSAIILVIGIFLPIWIEKKEHKITLLNRFLTFWPEGTIK